MSKKWTDEEINFLIENYKKEGAKYCSDTLNRKIYAIRKKANMLNISYVKNKRIYEKEFIQKVVNDSVSYKESLIKMGLRAAGGNYKILKKYINLYGLSISHFESPEEVSKRNLFKDKIPLDEVLVENSTYSRTSLKIRLYDENILERKCCLCGQDENWNEMKISLILDHINGVHNDNRIENLRIVCPNCNAGLDTFAGKNSKTIRKKYYCVCGSVKNKKSNKCKKCTGEDRRKVERPNIEDLMKEVEELGYSAVGRKYSVSDNAIRKWIKNNI
jgi:uncharacterized protein YfkK (UPF0435 family)